MSLRLCRLLPCVLTVSCWVSAVLAPQALAADQLVIISPHRKSIQDEFIPRFKDWYQATHHAEVDVQWLDNGGSADALRLVRSKFGKSGTTAGIDVFWGGGTLTFLELLRTGQLAPANLPASVLAHVPERAQGVPLYDGSKTWFATALSSFGIFANRKLLKVEGLSEPSRWDDLGQPKFRGQITATDPRHSGTAVTMDLIVLEALGWDKGWDLLTRIAGNTRNFTHSSSDPIKAVVAGDTAAAMAIDFYALPKIAEVGADNLSFTLPAGQTILDPDPAAILKGAPHQETARRFLTYLLSPSAQALLMLPKGAKDGPRLETLGRMAVNTEAYQATEGRRISPFNPLAGGTSLAFSADRASRLGRPLADLVGAYHVDTHRELKAAWEALIKRGLPAAEVARLVKAPVTSEELLKLNDRWNDPVFRSRTINGWVEAARTQYRQLAGH